MTRPEAVTLALFDCGGERDTIHTEDVAVKVAELAPGMFSWERHKERIDKELVRVALSDARLKKKFVVGSHDRGWMLTSSGLDFARANATQGSRNAGEVRRGRAQQQVNKERVRLMSSDAYTVFAADGTDAVSADQADDFFRLNLYVRGAARERKIARIENDFGNDPELGALVRELASRARERT